MTSATEAELAALYIMAREAVYIRIILDKMGHPQPPTPLQMDNSMADGVDNDKNNTKTNKGHGHAIPLAPGPRMPRTISNILAARKTQLRRLLDKTSSGKTPSDVRRKFLNPHIMVEMLRQENANHAAAAA